VFFQKSFFMKNRNTIFFLLILVMTGVRLDAQQFFFSPVRPGTCNAADGILTIVPTRGVPPFTYQWSTGATGLSLKNIPKGAYTATLTDATGATVEHTHILNSEAFDLYLSDSRPSSFCNANSGSLTVDPLGGVAPFTYTWSTGQTGSTVQGLVAGDYSVTVLDATGCSAEGIFTVETTPFTYYPQARVQFLDEPDCQNPSNGVLEATMINSNYPPFTYVWSTGATTQTIGSLPEGNYSVTITDALGCSNAATTTLKKKLTVTGSVVCSGSNTGTAGALLAGATAPVSYVWSNGQTGPGLSNLSSGNYGVTATDANGCNSSGQTMVSIPVLGLSDYSPKCYAGNNGVGSCWVQYDQGTSYLWDNGSTDAWNNTLSQGQHTITVTTALGCTLTGSLNIAPPVAPPVTINYTTDPADCTNGTGGALHVTITGGVPPYTFYAYGPDNFISSDISSLQNIKGGTYNLYAYTAAPNYCYGYTAANVPDVAGFEPELVVQDIDCTTGYGSAAVINVTTPGAQYEWNMGATGPALFNLTQGCYSVTVTAGGACVTYFDNICLQSSDTIQFNSLCAGIATGALINDLGIVGCTGSTGIPFQLIRTMPSGALHFTDQNGVYTAQLPNGAFDIEALNYDPSDIACPPGGFHTVNSVINTTTSGLDFHFYNTTATDHRVRQKALRTAQPGYPYSLRYEVCNDGATANAGVMDLAFGNFFGSLATAAFPRHPGAFTLNSETAGIPDNTANFGFPAITPGGCEMLQVDFLTPTSTPVGTEFITRATVSPSSGDPTPDNNVATLFNTVTGSFDPNSVLAFPARNGNPRDGGSIWWNIDHTITYQIFFQNTGNAPADFVMVRDTLDVALNVSTIRNMSASHDVDISLENDNKVLVFKFPNIGLPDSTSDFAGSIGSVQFDIDLHPGLPPGTEISKQAAIYFDFNSPVITNNNLLKIVSNTGTNAATKNALILFPNPAVQYFGFFTDTAAGMRMFNAMGELVSVQQLAPGIQQISTEALPSGVYFVHVEADGKVQSGKVVVSH
jgi:uncharacterized repeat protein (TIGR01451 family)